MKLKKLLGEKVKFFRKNRNLTQEQFAEMIEIAPRNLSRIELGESFVTAETLERILNVLNITAEELFSYKNLKETDVMLTEIYDYIDLIKTNRAKVKKIYHLINLVKENEI